MQNSLLKLRIDKSKRIGVMILLLLKLKMQFSICLKTDSSGFKGKPKYS